MGLLWAIVPVGVLLYLSHVSNPNFWLPYFYLITPFREEAYNGWKTHGIIDEAVHYELRSIPEIMASDYTYESMVRATENFRRPAVVRGLFNDSAAVKFWNDRDYLAHAFGDSKIPVVRDGLIGTLQDDRSTELFSSAYRRLFDSDHSKEYLFFPAKSRFSFPGVEQDDAERLEARGNEILKRDLDLTKIRPGFGEPGDKLFMTGQFVIGKAPEDVDAPRTGSDFHCAGANNWFVQVAGRKRWLFVMPEYSAYLWPLKSGLFNMWTSRDETASIVNHLPVEYVDLNPGDLLLNPPWQWHKIINYPGLSIGCPVREKNFHGTVFNNPYFFSVIALNKALLGLGFTDGTGGLPPRSAATEHDN